MFWNLFAKRYSTKEKVLFRFLRQSKLFEKLTDDELAEFVPFLHLRKYVKNEAIFFRNDPSQALYIIKAGEIMLNLDVQDKFEELIIIKKGESFGDNALLEGARRNYNAICYSEYCDLYVLPQTNILTIFEENIEIKAKVLHAFAYYYDQYLSNVFKAYRDTFTFFDLSEAYLLAKRNMSKIQNEDD
jgi:CRP-like cAMP-binding protein